MKLIELFQQIPEDYAVRSVMGSDTSPDNLPTFDPAYSKVIGTFDGKDVWGSREKRGYEIYGFKDDEKVIAYLVIDEQEIRPNVYQFKEIWVNPDFRRKGLGAGLILFLVRKIKIILMLTSDELVSDDAKTILVSLGKVGKIKIEDESGDLTTFETILSSKQKNNHTLLIREESTAKKLFGGRMQFDNGQSSLVEAYSIGVMQEWTTFD